MIARVASFEGVDVQAAERTMPEAERLVRGLLENLSGYRGYLDLVAADGKFLAIALFDSEEDAEAAEPVFDEEMPKQLGHLFQQWAGRRVSVERYRVLAQERR